MPDSDLWSPLQLLLVVLALNSWNISAYKLPFSHEVITGVKEKFVFLKLIHTCYIFTNLSNDLNVPDKWWYYLHIKQAKK